MITSKHLKEQLNEMKLRHQEANDYRAENYYIKCIDDYSYGGLQDRAANLAENRLQGLIDLMTIQEEQGYVVHTLNIFYLCRAGKTLSSDIVYTKYGKAWRYIDENKNVIFVSVPAKEKTLWAKGYECFVAEIDFKAIYTGQITRHGNYVANVEKIDSRASKMGLRSKIDNDDYIYYLYTLQNFMK